MSRALNIERLRADTEGCARAIHLNNAGAGLMPRPIAEAITDHIALEARVGGYEAAAARSQEIADAHRAVAALIGCRPREIAFVDSATTAYAKALSALDLKAGDIILTTRADYASNQIMFLSLARRAGVRVVRIPNRSEGGADPQAAGELIDRLRPRLVAVSHVPTHTGLIQDIEAIGRACRASDTLFLVDACQSVGQLPLDVTACGCDFLSASCRKFLRGPRGIGFLYVSERALAAGYEPAFIDMRGATWTGADSYRPAATAKRFETWEAAYCLLLGAGAAARYALDLGVDRTWSRTRELTATLRSLLAAGGLRVLDKGPSLGAIVMVALPGDDPEDVHRTMSQQGINTSVSQRTSGVLEFDEWGVDWALRLSPHYYNTESELERAVDAIERI